MPRLLQRRNGEAGAVAVMVALLSTVLVGMSAFSVDLGMSYVSTRQLQTAADAAALAAGAKYTDIPGTCPQMISAAAASGVDTAARNAGNDLRLQNRPGSTASDYAVWCDGTQLRVKYQASGDTASFFGGVWGHTGPYARSAEAVATVEPAPQARAKPYAICSGQLPTLIPSSTVVKLRVPSPSEPDATSCPTAEIGGNWWTTQCPEDGNANQLGDNTANGCEDELTIVPNQPATSTPADRSTFLTNACHTPSASCLGTNTGNVNGTPVISEWDQFVTQQTKIIVPVFCGETACDPAAIYNPSGGGNIIYPIYRLAALRICGYRFGPNYRDNLTGDCADSAYPPGYTAANGDSNTNYMLVKPTAMRVSGGTAEFACDLGAACDGGARRVVLTK